MATLPQWMSKTPVFVCHPAQTLKDVSKVLRVDAKQYRACGNKDAAQACMRIANRLEAVANGSTWAEAFDL